MLMYENKTPDRTLTKLNNHECQMYQTSEHKGS